MPQVIGESSTSQDPAVNGENAFNPKYEQVRLMGPGYGVRGQTSAGYAGVYGEGGENGVFGFSKSPKGSGVFGRSDAETGGKGVAGYSKNGQGVYGSSESQAGVVGDSAKFDGVWGQSESPDHAGVSGHNDAGGWAGWFSGKVNITGDVIVGGDVIIPNADAAEDFPMVAEVEPGSVVVVDVEEHARLCDQAYDTRVIGVVSGAGAYRPGIILDRTSARPGRQPVALLGKVYCMVDATFGAVSPGDLLTTSPTPGHAMRAQDPSRRHGSVLGKALGSLARDRGLIPILVTLQ